MKSLGEREWQALVVQVARLHGWTTFHVLQSRGMEPGWPDVVFLRTGEALFIELKTDIGKVTVPQKRTLALLAAAGCETAVWRPSDEPAAFARLGAPKKEKSS